MASATPYKGNEPYIFISYAHKDMDRVLPIVAQLQQDGCRVWYDEGISPGSEWDENIAVHLAQCDFFIAFLSKNYLNSDNCMDELAYARDLHKQQVLLCLESVKLPQGTELRVGRSPRFRVTHHSGYFSKLYGVEGIARCGAPTEAPRKPRLLRWVLPAGILAALLILAAIMASPTKGTVLLDCGGVTITLQSMEFDSEGSLVLHTRSDNTTDQPTIVFLETLQINGVLCEEMWSDIPQGKGQDVDFRLSYMDLASAGLGDLRDISQIMRIDGTAYADDYRGFTQFSITPKGEDAAILPEYIPNDDHLLLAEDNGIRLYLTDCFYDEATTWWTEYVAVNTTDRGIYVYIDIDCINGYLMSQHLTMCHLPPHSSIRLRSYVGDWRETGYDQVLQASGTMTAFEWDGPDVARAEFEIDLGGQDFPLRTLRDTDEILADNEYVHLAVIGEQCAEGRCALQLYFRSKHAEPLRLELYCEEEHSLYYLLSTNLPAGAQGISRNRFAREEIAQDGALRFTLAVSDMSGQPIATQQISYTPDWK